MVKLILDLLFVIYAYPVTQTRQFQQELNTEMREQRICKKHYFKLTGRSRNKPFLNESQVFDTNNVKFSLRHLITASPDGLICDEGIIEMKCSTMHDIKTLIVIISIFLMLVEPRRLTIIITIIKYKYVS